MNRTVHIEHLRGPELETAIRDCPIIYIPIGVLEWHGPHLPIGMDTFAAMDIARRCAEQSGGLVYPAIWQHDQFNSLRALLAELFGRLINTGFRVMVLITQHNGRGVLDTARRAAHQYVYDKKMILVATMATNEAAPTDPATGSDHGAYWETSYMHRLCPRDVDMAALSGRKITLDMSPPLGVGGARSPLDADAQAGEQGLEHAAAYVQRLALEALAKLTPEQRAFHLPAISPEHWWFI